MEDGPAPGRVLVLGGTQWLGRAIAAAHLARGAEVTCLAQGESGSLPTGARLVAGDRDASEAYRAVSGEWDEVVDVTRLPAHAARALDALADRAAHWTFVSSVSAQRLEAPVGADEDDQLVPEDPTGEEYGGAKAWIERIARERLGERLTIVRPGLIGGPGDPSDRFGHWPRALRSPATDPAGVGYWAGPRALPLVLPLALTTHAQRSSARYLGAGGEHRALRDARRRARGRARTRARPAVRRQALARRRAPRDRFASLVA